MILERILKNFYLLKLTSSNRYLKAFCIGVVIIICLSILVFLVSPFQYLLGTYTSKHQLFRLSKTQVEEVLSGKKLCQSITICPLQPGDILLRRYITPKTKDFDRYLHPYFTHSAFYLGEGEIVEAIGTEKRKENEILVENMSDTDWKDRAIEKLVVIRPHYTKGVLSPIKTNLVSIASDPEYRFGLPKTDNKMTTCADLIFKQLYLQRMIPTSTQPKIITPDYLFWILTNNTNDFETINYTSISEK